MDNPVAHSLSQIIKEKLTFEVLSKREPPLKTGFAQMDQHMSGGITPGLIVLGAGPGLGKSTFCLQLAEQISRGENVPVLYFSLEMTEERVAAKAVAMDNFRTQKSLRPDDTFSDAEADRKRFFTAAELFNPESLHGMAEEKRQQYEEARYRVSENHNLYIVDKPYCARKIVEYVKSFLTEQSAGENPSKKPLVIVDYLQILPPDPKGRALATDKQQVELNLKILRELILMDIPVLLISSLSRGNYSGAGTGPMKADSFKETGGIEYSADVLLGLQFSACHDSNGCNPDEEKGKYPRDAEIIILKQRYGGADIQVPLRYYAQFDYMEEKGAKPETFPDSGSQTSETEASGKQASAAKEVQPKKPASKAPKGKYYMNNTKIAYHLRNGKWESGKPVKCNVAKPKMQPVFTEFTVTGELTVFDCEVADALYSLYKHTQHLNKQKEFTLRQLLYTLTGDKVHTLTDQKKEELGESVKRLMNAHIKIVCTEEMVQMRKIEEFLPKENGKQSAVIFEGKFANLTEKDGKYIFAEENGKDPMPLYSYGEYTKQMVSVPMALLSARGKRDRKIPDTANNIVIKHHLIRRLEVIRNKKNSMNHLHQISYYSQTAKDTSGLLVMLGVKRDDFTTQGGWTKKLSQTHAAVTGILDSFVACGYISGYQERDKTGVTLPKEVKDPNEISL